MIDEENQTGGILGYTQRLKNLGGISTTPANPGIAGDLKKPGPISRALESAGIAALPPTDPDTDGRRVYSPTSGDAFANRQVSGVLAKLQNEGRAISRPPGDGSVAQTPTPPLSAGDRTSPEPGGIAAPTIAQTPGRDANGIITADSAAAAAGNNMMRSGGITGSYDGKGVNDILARENKARGEMIDTSIAANGGNGIAVLPDRTEAENAEKTTRWRQDELLSQMHHAGRSGKAAIGQALAASIAGQNQIQAEQLRQQGALDQRGIMAGIETSRQAGMDQRATDRNQVQVRGQDLTASTAAERMASQERIATQRNDPTGSRLTLPQRRSNFEIDAARERIAGLTPEEIKQKTQQFSATGRENSSFDPTLAKAVFLANRRKYGDDAHFDQREQAPQPAGNDGDVMTRFRGDQTMQGHKTGQVTDQGLEVFDASGRLIGHYR